MQMKVLGTVLKLAVASLAVGLVLAWLDIRPQHLYRHAGEAARDAVAQTAEAVGWAWDYVLLGAIVVVPAWLVWVTVRRLRGGR